MRSILFYFLTRIFNALASSAYCCCLFLLGTSLGDLSLNSKECTNKRQVFVELAFNFSQCEPQESASYGTSGALDVAC